jgi:cation diffusion facilitator family transporter
MDKKEQVSFLGILANIFLAVAKIFIGIISRASSILADGINSATDVVSSIISYVGIRWAKKPADKRHPYGHGQAEVIAGFVITFIIITSAVWIIADAVKGFFTETELALSSLAFGVMAGSALVNGVMSLLKVHFGKKYNSASLISDGIHSRIDLLVSLGIFISLFFIPFYPKIDSVIALLVGIYILIESFKLGGETTLSLMGARADEETENKIKETVEREKINVIDLKTQKLGEKVFAEITIELPSKIEVQEASSITHSLQKKLVNEIENLSYVSIQIKSHDMQEGYYKPRFSRGFGWRGKGRFTDEIPQAHGGGPGGYCVCPEGDYKVRHQRGTPCSELKCPNHNIPLVREEQ